MAGCSAADPFNTSATIRVTVAQGLQSHGRRLIESMRPRGPRQLPGRVVPL